MQFPYQFPFFATLLIDKFCMPCNAINLQVDFHVDLQTDSQYQSRKNVVKIYKDDLYTDSLYTSFKKSA